MPSITLDVREGDEELLRASYEELMGAFDFDEVARVVKKMKYKYRHKNGKMRVPGVKTIKKNLSEALLELMENRSLVCDRCTFPMLRVTKVGSVLNACFAPVRYCYHDSFYDLFWEQVTLPRAREKNQTDTDDAATDEPLSGPTEF